MIGDNLNEAVGADKIREYIWFTETKENFQKPNADKPYYLGSTAQTGYYFFYDPNRACVLDYKFLSPITVKADNYVIYADRCMERMTPKFGGTFVDTVHFAVSGRLAGAE